VEEEGKEEKYDSTPGSAEAIVVHNGDRSDRFCCDKALVYPGIFW